MNKSVLSKSVYRSEIDGLRAFAVLSVVAFHAFPSWLKGGFIGVDVFFVISGFLITSHIFENLDKGKFSFADFFGRRVRRIFPALILVMASSLALGWFVLLADEYVQLGKHVASGAVFVVNFVLVNESGYFDNAAETKPMLHLWSLAVEEQFYIIWPLALWFAWKRQLNLLSVTVIVAVISFYLNLRFVYSRPNETFFWPIGRFWELLSGSILAWLMLYKREHLTNFKLWIDRCIQRVTHSKAILPDGATASNIMALVGLLLLVYGVVRINEGLPFPSKWALIPVLGAVLVISAGSEAWFSRVFLMNPIAVWFGLISYPLYLWHWPILSFLQIVKGEVPHRDNRILAVLVSILLAWLTYKLIENPIRFGRLKNRANTLVIVCTLFVVGGVGYFISTLNLSDSHGYKDLLFERKSFEHAIGGSLKWYEGKENWLFLGNDYDDTVAKLKLSEKPSKEDLASVVNPMERLVRVASQSNTGVALIVGPNKSSIYSEYLPTGLTPSDERYISFFLDELSKIPNLVVFDPTIYLQSRKSAEGLLYWRTNTHWNQKGAFFAFEGLAKMLDVPIAAVVGFKEGAIHSGDLIGISKLEAYPLSSGDDWHVQWAKEPQLHFTSTPNQPDSPFGKSEVVTNDSPSSNKTVWVIGDSFTGGLRPYFDATFKEVRYVGHWADGNIDKLASELAGSSVKPDLVIVVRVERSF